MQIVVLSLLCSAPLRGGRLDVSRNELLLSPYVCCMCVSTAEFMEMQFVVDVIGSLFYCFAETV